MSHPSLSKVADYLVWLWEDPRLVSLFGQGPPLYAVLCLSL